MAKPLKSITFPGLEGEYEVLLPSEIQALVNNGKTKVVKLWETANWGGSFEGEQYIDLGENSTTANYDCIAILCNYSVSYNHRAAGPIIFGVFNTTVAFLKGQPGSAVNRWFRRDGGQNGRYVYVGHGYKEGTQDNTVCIPNTIYGIKW